MTISAQVKSKHSAYITSNLIGLSLLETFRFANASQVIFLPLHSTPRIFIPLLNFPSLGSCLRVRRLSLVGLN